jgi:hypothetical protein
MAWLGTGEVLRFFMTLLDLTIVNIAIHNMTEKLPN